MGHLPSWADSGDHGHAPPSLRCILGGKVADMSLFPVCFRGPVTGGGREGWPPPSPLFQDAHGLLRLVGDEPVQLGSPRADYSREAAPVALRRKLVFPSCALSPPLGAESSLLVPRGAVGQRGPHCVRGGLALHPSLGKHDSLANGVGFRSQQVWEGFPWLPW